MSIIVILCAQRVISIAAERRNTISVFLSSILYIQKKISFTFVWRPQFILVSFRGLPSSSCRLKDMESVILSLANNYKEFNSSQDEGWLINIFVHPYNVPISRLKRQKMIAQYFSPFLCSIIPLMESLTPLYERDFLSQIKERDMQACSKNSIISCNPRMKIRRMT